MVHKIENMRMGNLEFRMASYLLPKEKWPNNPSYDIVYWYPNEYYGKESQYIKKGEWYVPKSSNYPYSYRIHQDCFKSPESCYTIASFNYDKEDDKYYFIFIDDRPLVLKDKIQREAFWKLIKYGYKYLNNKQEDETD